MKRWIAVCISLIFVAGCSGMGGGGNRFLPGFGNPNAKVGSKSGSTLDADGRGRHLSVAVRMRIPKRHRGERAMQRPATISSLTASVSIAVNSNKAQVFNATIASSNCVTTLTGRACTFTVGAPAGTDKFTVTTYSGPNGTGTALNRGIGTVPILLGKANSPKITLGPLVSTASNTGLGSLRYAVGSANPGDTILFSLPATAKITVSSPITINTNVTIAGPGVSSALAGLTISGGGSQQIFIVNTGVTATISGLVLSGGKASVAHQPGGAISNQGTLTLASDAVTGNTSEVTSIKVRPHNAHLRHKPHGASKARLVAPAKIRPARLTPHCTASSQYGGAVYNNGLLTVTGTTFSGNSVSSLCGSYGYGGAIYNDSNGSILSSGNTYTGNRGEYGGAIYNAGTNGQASFSNDKFIANVGCTAITGCPTSGCVATDYCTSYAQGYGAAIYDDSGPGVTITSSTFTNNVAGGTSGSSYGEGGALNLETGSPLITGSTFSGNVAGGGSTNCSSGYGGAIYEDESGTLEIDKDSFTGNRAGGDYYSSGGAIYNDSNPDNGSGDTFTNNMTYASGSLCDSGYSGYAWGGAISAYYGLNISGSTFTGNVATASYWGYGGAIYVYYNPSNISGNTFTSNKAIGTSVTDVDSYAYGAGVYVDSGGAVVKLSKNTFTGNQSNAIGPYGYEVYGGIVYNYSTVNSTNNTFTSNSDMATYPDDGEVYGMVAYNGGSLYTSSGDVYKSNTATNSANNPLYEVYGVFYNDSTGAVSNDTFTSNSAFATYVYGAAIENESTLTVNNSTFTSNVAGSAAAAQQGYGGAVYEDGCGTWNGDTFTGNTATVAGGGIYDDCGMTINNSRISGNSVPLAVSYYGGGGIYAYATTLNTSTVSGNTVTAIGLPAGGGGIFGDCCITINGSTISGNKVLGSLSGTGGGGLYVYTYSTPAPNTITNSTITGNSSGTDGGGVLTFTDGGPSHDGSAVLLDATIYQNKATGNGGNIENQTSKTMVGNDIIAGGTAATGADIDNQGTLTSADYNLIQAVISGTALAGTTTHDITGKNPLLQALSNNGGPTFTNAETASSPSIGKIPATASVCYGSTVSVDQRGYTRGATTCDMGAFELNGTPSAIRVREGRHLRPAHIHQTQRHRHPKRPAFEIHRSHKGSK